MCGEVRSIQCMTASVQWLGKRCSIVLSKLILHKQLLLCWGIVMQGHEFWLPLFWETWVNGLNVPLLVTCTSLGKKHHLVCVTLSVSYLHAANIIFCHLWQSFDSPELLCDLLMSKPLILMHSSHCSCISILNLLIFTDGSVVAAIINLNFLCSCLHYLKRIRSHNLLHMSHIVHVLWCCSLVCCTGHVDPWACDTMLVPWRGTLPYSVHAFVPFPFLTFLISDKIWFTLSLEVLLLLHHWNLPHMDFPLCNSCWKILKYMSVYVCMSGSFWCEQAASSLSGTVSLYVLLAQTFLKYHVKQYRTANCMNRF